MSRNHLIALVLALATLPNIAVAELRGSPEGPPTFSTAETQVIVRNAVLSSLIQTDPWVVRRLLDSLAAAEAQGAKSAPSGDIKNKSRPNVAPVDPRTNPDLDRLQRSSPEAVLDLFTIIKRAGTEKKK